MAAGGHIIALVLPGMEGVKNISWATNIFPMPLCSVNASPLAPGPGAGAGAGCQYSWVGPA